MNANGSQRGARGAKTGLLAAALVTLGAGAGALAAHQIPASGSGAATPIPAESPSVPASAAPSYLPDPTLAPLVSGVALKRFEFEAGTYSFTADVPKGWQVTQIGAVEWKFRPPDFEYNTYVLRIKQVSGQHLSVQAFPPQRAADLERVEQDVTILDEGDDSLSFTYNDTGYQRMQHLRWIEAENTGEAAVEIALAGRTVDDAGMIDLLDRVAQSVQQ